MQLPTLAVILSLTAFGAAQTTNTVPQATTTGCRNGQYECGYNGGSSAIFICSGGQLLLSAICARRCEFINGLPYCT